MQNYRTVTITVGELVSRLAIVTDDFEKVLKGLGEQDLVTYTFLYSPFGNYPISVSKTPRTQYKVEISNREYRFDGWLEAINFARYWEVDNPIKEVIQ